MAKATKKQNDSAAKVWGLTRITLGLIFLWAFVDKLFGLGFATCRNAETNAIETMCSKAWLEGGSPTTGFLKFGTSGPFADFYQGLAGNVFIDWLFMIGLAGIGVALTLGIGMHIATISGAIMMLMMWTAAFWPANNPLLDDHIVYALVLVGLWRVNDTQQLGYGAQWAKTKLVKQYPILK